MHIPAETPKSKQTIPSAEAVQENRDGLSGIAMTDNRPEAIAQRKLQALANNSSQVKQLKALQEMVNANNKKIVQRKVFQNPISAWGPGMGKWFSNHDTGNPKKLFNTEVEAQAYDNEIDPEKVEKRKESECWDILGSARRHFKDGWGKLYGITSDEQLVAKIKTVCQPNESVGSKTSIPLGIYTNENTHEMNVACNIAYRVTGTRTYKPGGQDIEVPIRIVFHCGPSTQANATAGSNSTAAAGGGASAGTGSNQSAASAASIALAPLGSEADKKLFPELPGSK